MKKYIFIVILGLSFRIYGDSFVVQGPYHRVDMNLPRTWSPDTNTARTMGISGYFYLWNYPINKTPASILVSVAGKDRFPSIESFIDFDTRFFISENRGFTARRLYWNIWQNDGYQVVVYELYNPDSSVHQYSAYINSPVWYYATVYIQLYTDDPMNVRYLDDFRTCLERLSLSN